jgi:PAS domain S-box-containing protein
MWMVLYTFAMAEASPTLTHDTQLFRDVFNSSPIGIAVENLEGQPLFVNAAFCAMLGFSEEELHSKHCVDFSPPEDAEKDWVLFQQLRAGSIDHYQLEKRYFRRDGSLVWGRLSISLLKSRPSPLVIAMVEEITDKKTAEDGLRASEERLRLAQQAARIGAFERDVRTGVLTWTSEIEAMYGLPPGAFNGTNTAFFANLVHPDDRAGLVELINAALKTGQPTRGEWRVVWPDESVHWIAGRWQVFMDEFGKPARMVGTNMDVTERKRAQDALLYMNRTLEAQTALLRSREDLLKIFVKSVPAGVAMLDRDMRYLQVSDRWCADYSVDSSQLLGRSHYELFPDVPQRWKEMHRRVLDGETFRAQEDRWDREDGTTLWVRWEVRPWETPSGTIGGILIFAEDISKSKQAEDALLDMSRKLVEAHEQERTRIGRDLHDDVVQRLALLAIGLEAIETDLPDSVAEVRRQIVELRDQTTQITNDVQLLSHELHSSKLDYLGIVGAAKNFCKELGERYKVEIDFQSRDVPADSPAEVSLTLFRVLQEALRNAMKHSGVKHFEVRLWGSAGEIHLTVSDLGAGFDAEAAKKSIGLGLTSMQERLRLVNGELAINSRPKGGTTVQARVPVPTSSNSARAVG